MTAALRPLRVGIYARVADTDFTAADAAIARLLAILEPRVPAHRRLEVMPYPEVGETGLGQPGPVLGRLLADAREGRLDAVLVDHVRALALVPRRQAELAQGLAAAGVQVIAEEFVRAWPVVRRRDAHGSGTTERAR